jgi:hypothetical protein
MSHIKKLNYKSLPRGIRPSILSALYRAIGIDPLITFQDNAGWPTNTVDDREPKAYSARAETQLTDTITFLGQAMMASVPDAHLGS